MQDFIKSSENFLSHMTVDGFQLFEIIKINKYIKDSEDILVDLLGLKSTVVSNFISTNL